MNIGIIGNTKQTLKGIRRLLKEGYKVRYVFGLCDKMMKGKVNSISLSQICADNDI